MLDLAGCWEPRIFFKQDFIHVSICRSLYDTGEKQRESQQSEIYQHSAQQNLPN